MEKNCLLCAWWEGYPEELDGQGNPVKGRCRAFPLHPEYGWPTTLAVDWCGQFKEKQFSEKENKNAKVQKSRKTQ